MKLLLLDWDETLFDSNLFKKRFSTLLEHEGISQGVIDHALLAYYKTLNSSTDFNPRNFFHFLAHETSTDSQKLYDIFWNTPTLYTQSLYPDTLPFLNEVKKRRYTLGLFSEGVIEFQKHKVQYSGVSPYFHKKHWHIFREKTNPVAIKSLPEGIIIDNKHEIVSIMQKHGFIAHYLDRSSMQLRDLLKKL